MTKKVLSILIAILILIIFITLASSILHYSQRKKSEEFINYINSEEMDSEVKTPEFMHVVLATYKGNNKGLGIVKSINYFVNKIIPELKKECGNKFSTKLYYNTHKIQLKNQTGIDNFDDFYKIIDKCNSLEDINIVEYIKFDVNSIERETDGVRATLYLKYNNSQEISFNIKILNEVYEDRTSVNIR